jgi:hypothetical protein
MPTLGLSLDVLNWVPRSSLNIQAKLPCMKCTSMLVLSRGQYLRTVANETNSACRYMYLNEAEMNYFIEQAVKGLILFGFSDADAQFVNMTLNAKFNKRWAPAEPIIPPSAGPQLQPICIAPDCALSQGCKHLGQIRLGFITSPYDPRFCHIMRPFPKIIRESCISAKPPMI